ncbi:hypothetical protein Tco_0781632 [Tanacetum coccineum]
MIEMFRLLKELTTSRAPEKVLIREEAKHPVTKNINSISLIRGKEEKNEDDNAMTGDSIKRLDGSDAKMPLKEVKKENEAENGTKTEPIKTILEKKITKKEDIGGNFEIPCNIGGLKHINALVDQGSDMNVMPLSTYKKLTDEWPAEMDIRLSLSCHSLYLIRRSLEVLRKFHWMILGGRFNQLSLVSSPLFSKPGEYNGTNALSKFSLDTKLVLHPLQDKLTSGDKSLDLSAFKLSRLFFSLLSSGSSSCWRSYRAQ